MKLPKLLEKPSIPKTLPDHSKWLTGEGAGSWFVFEKKGELIHVQRYNPQGEFECENNYCQPEYLNINQDFKIDYPSHCSVVTIIQSGMKFRLEAKP